MAYLIRTAALPWNAFVASFLYYVLLAVLALAGVSPPFAVVGTAYLAPLVAYAVLVAARITHMVAAPAPLRPARAA